MAYVITGAGGFIGSAVAEALIRRGEKVAGLDSLSKAPYPADWKTKNIARLSTLSSGRGQFIFEEGDASDRRTVEALFSSSGEVRGAVHLAAYSGVQGPAPEEYIRHNVLSTAILADVAGAARCHGFVLASSGSVYGDRGPVRQRQPAAAKTAADVAETQRVAVGLSSVSAGDGDPEPFSEDHPASNPLSPYAASKRSAELMLHALGAERYGLPCTVLRIFTCYGPRGRPDMAPLRFSRALLSGEAIEQMGDGRSWRDYVYIDDVVSAVLAALDRPSPFAVLNVAGGKAVSLLDLIAAAEVATGRQAVVQQRPGRPGDVGGTFARIEAAAAVLGWAPQVSLAEGLRRTVDWLETAEGQLYWREESRRTV